MVRFLRGCEQTPTNASLLVCLVLLPASYVLRQRTCQRLLLLSYSLSSDCGYATAPGRSHQGGLYLPLFLCPGEAAGKARGPGRSAGRRKRDRLRAAAGSFTRPSLLPFFFSLWLPAFLWTCVLQDLMCMRVHTVAHVHALRHSLP